MSRVAKKPIEIPPSVDVEVDGRDVTVTGPRGVIKFSLHPHVRLVKEAHTLVFDSKPTQDAGMMMAGTMRALLNNVMTGVSEGFERRLELIGVGYRAQARGRTLNLVLGFSHPIDVIIPEGVTIETPTQTEVVIKGVDKQLVGHVAAQIRGMRPPEPYKGKGVRYMGEPILRKEAKKK